MKKLLFMSVAALCLCGLSVTFTSCGDDDEKKNPEQTENRNEDQNDDQNDGEDQTPSTPAVVTTTFESAYFTALIDNPQYMGPQLYPQGDDAELYSWKDEETTLSSTFTNAWGDKQYWGGGIAISNYIDEDIVNHADIPYQLSVPKSNGSSNFAVVNGTASITLDEAKVINSIDVMNTTYGLGVIKNGNAFAVALTDAGSYLTVVATGYNGDESTGEVKIDLARDGSFVEDWTTVNFTSLGAVTKVTFTMEGSDSGDWGLNSPAYFAFDNVVIAK